MRNDAPPAPGGNSSPPRFSRRQSWADLLPRIFSAIALMAAAFFSVWQGGLVFNLIWLGAAAAVGMEWQILVKAPRPRLRVLAIACALIASAYAVNSGFYGAAFAILACGGLAAACAAGPERKLWAFGGTAYAGVLLLSVSVLHGSAEFGARAILWLFAVVWGTDVFAYFGGRLIGGPKLWPAISPSKTWSGTLTGVLIGAALGVAAGSFGLDGRTRLPLLALGLAASAISQAGDIFESWVKRHFGAKDSSALIPGHGGFMDRLDGFIAAAAFAALAGLARGKESSAAGLFMWD